MKLAIAKLRARLFVLLNPGWYQHRVFDGGSGRVRLVGAMNPEVPCSQWRVFYLLPGRD